MTTDRDFDRLARAWLDLMPDEAPDRTVAAVLQAVETTPQARPRLAGPWKVKKMSRFALVGAVATLVVLAGSILYWPRSSSEVAGPSSSPSVAPSSSPETVGVPVDDALRARWIATANSNDVLGNGAGPVSLSLSSVGTSMEAANFGAGHGYSSIVSQVGDRLEVALERAGGDCAAGARGVYGWTLSADRSQLTLNTLSEDCAKRGFVIARTWTRSLVSATTVGAGVVDSMDPVFAVTLPDGTYETRTLDDFAEIGGTDGFSLMVFKNPQGFVDSCSTAEVRYPYTPGAAAFVAYYRQNDAFTVVDATPLKIDGHDAIHLVTKVKVGGARCPSAPLYALTPKACNCHFLGGDDSLYLVDVGSDTFLFQLSPTVDSASETPIISSIRIPFQLPTQ